MSVRPIILHPDGSIDAVYDEQGHSGTIPAAEVKWSTNIDGTESHQFIVLQCPDGCGATSTWPVGGGADAVNGQQMFVQKVQREGCACGNVEASTNATPEAHVHLNVARMDGPERWQQDTAPVIQEQAGQPPMFQVVYRRSDRLVLGTHPRGGVGSDNGVAIIHDLAEWDVLMKTDPAYLSADGEHIDDATPDA